MSKEIDELLRDQAKYELTSEAVGLGLQLQFSEIVVDGLRRKGWGYHELAKRVGCPNCQIEEILSADLDLPLSAVGLICHVLGVVPELRGVVR